MLRWLPPAPVDFPDVDQALDEPNGLLAAGGALTPEWLLAAYRRGIFPWYGEGDPLLWWSPAPRMVLFPSEIRVRRSLAKRLRNGGFTTTIDHAFAEVIEACAAERADSGGTWIDAEMTHAYRRLHALGRAHSVETWRHGELVGGLYGIALGQAFFGESMFSRCADASKVALVTLARHLETHGFQLIDCQMHTAHLASMGAREIARETFIDYLEKSVDQPTPAGLWPSEPP
ncbi:leucyl/phenylalanyl-tRNA--protein transferase [Salinicola endophyticus]|uniref:leucyl/phenylalanyl-tRNA--protein transferase n=1 Tax=Salinicola endophyticus TaxID=1949083 RepID=UPI000DA1E413|nr:leucyl/phenylalanyl-tRNA--protein transferase [Salinicola endophyticus]